MSVNRSNRSLELVHVPFPLLSYDQSCFRQGTRRNECGMQRCSCVHSCVVRLVLCFGFVSLMRLVYGVLLQVGALILCHTRELAYQICHEFERFSSYLPDVRVGVIFGGINLKTQRETLTNEKPNVIVGTPGRVKQVNQIPSLNESLLTWCCPDAWCIYLQFLYSCFKWHATELCEGLSNLGSVTISSNHCLFVAIAVGQGR